MITCEEAIARFSKGEFNPKFGNTYGYDLETKKYVFVDRLDAATNYLLIYKDVSSFEKERIIKKPPALKTTMVGNIPPQYFNCRLARQAFYLLHLPVRVTKFGLDLFSNSQFLSPFWSSLPVGLREEFNRFTDRFYESFADNNYATKLSVLNLHFSPTFEESLKLILNEELFSVSFDPNWILSYNANHEGIGIYYRNIPVGLLDNNKKQINIVQPVLSQELKDLFVKKEIKQWSILDL